MVFKNQEDPIVTRVSVLCCSRLRRSRDESPPPSYEVVVSLLDKAVQTDRAEAEAMDR